MALIAPIPNVREWRRPVNAAKTRCRLPYVPESLPAKRTNVRAVHNLRAVARGRQALRGKDTAFQAEATGGRTPIRAMFSESPTSFVLHLRARYGRRDPASRRGLPDARCGLAPPGYVAESSPAEILSTCRSLPPLIRLGKRSENSALGGSPFLRVSSFRDYPRAEMAISWSHPEPRPPIIVRGLLVGRNRPPASARPAFF
jgi:hypothetical protein